MEYGKRLNPEHSLPTPKGIEGIRQKVIVTHNPSTIDQNQDQLVRFPNLGRNRLSYELKFNDYNRVINSSKTDATYKITDISLEYDIVTQPDLTRFIKDESDKMVLLYNRVIHQSQIPVNKLDTKWNWSFNNTCKSLKGILVLFEEEKLYLRDMSKFHNPKIEKVSVTVEGKPSQLYSQGMRSFEQYDETRKYFAEGRLANEVQAQLQLYD